MQLRQTHTKKKLNKKQWVSVLAAQKLTYSYEKHAAICLPLASSRPLPTYFLDNFNCIRSLLATLYGVKKARLHKDQ